MINAAKLRYKIECLAEDTPIRGNYVQTGDDTLDLEYEARALAELASGNEWAWCTVRVTCEHIDLPGLEGVAYLGGCSYLSERDFVKNGGYYSDLQAEARANLEDEMVNYFRTAERIKEEMATDPRLRL